MASEFSDGAAAVEAGAVDLYGMPVLPPRGRGRPGHVVTAESRRFVNLLFVCGHDPIAVARALGLKKTAFYEHYRQEIVERGYAALKFKGRQLARLNDAAEKGNVAAEKALAGMIQAEQLKHAARDIVRREPKAPVKGKKEVAQDKAWGAGIDDQDWGPLLHGETGTPLAN